MGDIVFEAGSLRDLANDLRDTALRVRAQSTPLLARMGETVTVRARAIAGEHSAKVAGSIRNRGVVRGAAIIEAGRGVPLAALYELGNKKAGRGKKTFKHPVYGKWITGTPPQDRHPFLRPALRETRREFKEEINRFWDESLRPLRLEG